MKLITRAFSMSLFCISQALAAPVLVQYYPDATDMTGGNVADTDPLPADFVGADVSASELTQNQPDGFFSHEVWPIEAATAFNVNEYASFTLTPAPMRELQFERLSFAGHSFNNSSVTLHLRWSVDGFATNLGSQTSTGGGVRDYTFEYDLRALPAQAGAVEFRLYPDDNGGTDDFTALRGPAAELGLVVYGVSRPLVITEGQCVDRFAGTVWQGHCYLTRETDQTFPTFEAEAQALDPAFHLVSIHSDAENAFVRSLVPNLLWVGLTDEAAEGVWVNLDGTPFDYENWGPGQPDNNLGLEHVAIMVADGTWLDTLDTFTANAVFKARIKQPLRITRSQCTGQFSGTIFDGHCYVVRQPNNTFHAYEAAAQALDPAFHLTSIHSSAENTYVRSRVAGGGIWVGVTDEAEENVWVNLDGTPFDYSNWRAGEPNNQFGPEEAVTIEADATWNDRSVDQGANAVFKAVLVEETILADGFEQEGE